VVQDVFRVLCLGSDPGFELEHPTTGFAICLNGSWAVVDAPVCASYLLAQHGIDSADVRVVFETHGHEDHMGSAIHFLLECVASGRAFTYVAAEPVYRTCVAKVAAILDMEEDEAHRVLGQSHALPEAPSGGVVRVQPGTPLRLLGATWHFAWMIHPVPTTGFRIEVEQSGRTHSLVFSSDTAPVSGAFGTEAMEAAGFLDTGWDPFPHLVKGGEDIVFWEAGGTAGDPIHFNARDWDALCKKHGVRPAVVFMHAHPMPPHLRHFALARPGMTWTLARWKPVGVAHVIKLIEALRIFRLEDSEYWIWLLLCQGDIITMRPGAWLVREGQRHEAWFIVVQGSVTVLKNDVPRRTIAAGGFFGELSILGDGLARVDVRTAGPTVLLRVPAGVFCEFVVANRLWSFFHEFWDDVSLLGKSRLFFGLPHQVVAELATSCERRSYKHGDVLLKTGDDAMEMFVIVRGEVSVEADHGTRMVRGPGEVLGEYGVLVPGTKRSATVRAEGDVEVIVLSQQVLDQIIAGQIPIQLRLVELLKERGMPVPSLADLTEK